MTGSPVNSPVAPRAAPGLEYGEPEDREADTKLGQHRQRRLAMIRATQSTRSAAVGGEGRSANRLSPHKLEEVYRQEPLLRRAIHKWSGAIVREWFKVVDPKTGQEHQVNQLVQAWARHIKLKRKLRDVLVASRTYGDILVEFEWDDDASSDQPVLANSFLVDVHTIDPVTATLREVVDENGDVRVKLVQQTGASKITLHPDRVRHEVIDRLEGRLRGLSAIEVAFHNAISKIQGDQASGEILFHAGVPHKHIKIIEATDDEIEFYTNMLKDPKFSRGLATDENISITQLNPVVLDPEPFYDHFRDSIAAAVGLPSMMVEGAQAGQVSGSETNLEDFRGDITDIRENILDGLIEDIIWGLTGLDFSEFEIKWNPFPRNKESEAKTWRELANAVAVLINSCRLKPEAAFELVGVTVKEDMFEERPRGVLPAVEEAPE